MENVRVGKLLTGDEKRDAIHIAIMPVICGEVEWGLRAGDHIGLIHGSFDTVVARQEGTHTGIVDPFLTTSVKPGQKFYMWMLPNTVTSLRHEWTHPIDNLPKPKSISEDWLRGFASKWNFDYDEMLREATATMGGEWDHFITARGIDLHNREELGTDHDLFWAHLEKLTGKSFDADHINNFGWSCSC